MGTSRDTGPAASGRARRLPRDAGALAVWALGCLPVVYLGLRGGGYDIVVRSEVGLVACWIVLFAAIARLLPRSPLRQLPWVCIGLLGGFGLWTGLASSWSLSAERTIAELGRISMYLGAFLLAVSAVRSARVRSLVDGVGVAFVVVSLLSVLSRLEPSLFPTNQIAEFFPARASRLSYPLNYWDGTGNFLAIGLPLLVLLATNARTLVGQGFGAAAAPVAVLGVVLTASRGAALTAIVGVVLVYLLMPDRIPRALTGLVVSGGSAVLVVGMLDRHALRNALSTPVAISQRHSFTLLLVVVCLMVGALQVMIGLGTRAAHRRRWLPVPRRPALVLGASALVVLVVAALVAGVPGKLITQWNTFKSTDTTGVVSGNVYARFGNVGGSHRYQYWQAAVRAWKTKPVDGIGPGTFEFYWAQHGSLYEFVRNAHSLYLETLAETGIIGFLLIIGLLGTVLVAGVWRTLRAPPGARVVLAATTASFAAICASAAYDWMWQFACVAVVLLLLATAIVVYCPGSELDTDAPPDAPATSQAPSLVPRCALAVLAIAASVAIAIPFAGTTALRSSQSEARAGRLSAALSDAVTSADLQPYAASPRVQEALIYEQARHYAAARVAIAAGSAREPSNYQIWLLRARIDAESAHPAQAAADYRRAHALNPLAPVTSL